MSRSGQSTPLRPNGGAAHRSPLSSKPVGGPTVQFKLDSGTPLVELIRNYVKDDGWKQLRPQTQQLFDSICTRKEVGHRDQFGLNPTSDYLTLDQMQQYFKLVGEQFFAQDLAHMVNDDRFERFNFNNSAGLDLLQAFRCLRFCLLESFHGAGAEAEHYDVKVSSPEAAGCQKVRQLGKGGQGTVWLARSQKYGDVVLKTYDRKNPNAGSLADLIQELMMERKLKASRYVMNSYEVFQDNQFLYVVNEYLPGGDFTHLRRKAGQAGVALSEDYFKAIFRQCLKGLSHIHERAIVHCDIKEPNIMVRNTNIADPQIAIIDLGLAKASAGSGLSGGTPGYRPPETNANDIWYPKGDIFSMGVTFFQLLANKVPDDAGTFGIFQEGARSLDDVKRFTATKPVPMHWIKGSYPGTLSWLALMTAKNRRERPISTQLLSFEWFQEDKTPRVDMSGAPDNAKSREDLVSELNNLRQQLDKERSLRGSIQPRDVAELAKAVPGNVASMGLQSQPAGPIGSALRHRPTSAPSGPRPRGAPGRGPLASGHNAAVMSTSMQPGLNFTTSPAQDGALQRIREALLRDGSTSLPRLIRNFRVRASRKDSGCQIDRVGFRKMLSRHCPDLSSADIEQAFNTIDQKRDAYIKTTTFTSVMLGTLNRIRESAISTMWQHLDRECNGKITYKELIRHFDATSHPDVVKGRKTPVQVLKDFVDDFDGGDQNGMVTQDEFQNYWLIESSCIEDDREFSDLLRMLWRPSAQPERQVIPTIVHRSPETAASDHQPPSSARAKSPVKSVIMTRGGRKQHPGLSIQQGCKKLQADRPDHKSNGTDLGFGDGWDTDAFCTSNMRKSVQYLSHATPGSTLDAPPLDRFRNLLNKRGEINMNRSGFGRKFNLADKDHNQLISHQEFCQMLHKESFQCSPADEEKLWHQFDRHGTGQVNFDDFVLTLRGGMNSFRMHLIDSVFDKFTKDGLQTVDIYDVRSSFKPSSDGDRSEYESYREFLIRFGDTNLNGRVTREQFHVYYEGVSSMVDDDKYFESMIRNSWHVAGGTGQAGNTSNLRVQVIYDDGRRESVTVNNDLGLDLRATGAYQEVVRRLKQQGITGIADVEWKAG